MSESHETLCSAAVADPQCTKLSVTHFTEHTITRLTRALPRQIIRPQFKAAEVASSARSAARYSDRSPSLHSLSSGPSTPEDE
jgi:hypothetical protein